MSNKKQQEQGQQTMESPMDFFAKKASFVAGIVLIITIFKDIYELYNPLPTNVVVLYLAITGFLFLIILGTKIVDKKMDSKRISNFGNFLTTVSVVFFIIENTVIRFQHLYGIFDTRIIVGVIGVAIIAGAAYLLFAKY